MKHSKITPREAAPIGRPPQGEVAEVAGQLPSASRARRWTARDDATLAQLVRQGKSLSEIAAQLERTVDAVERRERDLRAPEKSTGGPRRRLLTRVWTDAEDELLESLVAEGRSTAVIGRHLKRTPEAVRRRARFLRSRRPTTEHP